MTPSRAEVHAEVRRIRAAILARHGHDDVTRHPGIAAPSPAEEAARLATINAHWGISSDVPLLGPLVVLSRRVLRLMLRWYINPIVEQQNAFNEAAVRAIHDLYAENEQLRARIAGDTSVLAADAEKG
jgi:hypothetical protein